MNQQRANNWLIYLIVLMLILGGVGYFLLVDRAPEEVNQKETPGEQTKQAIEISCEGEITELENENLTEETAAMHESESARLLEEIKQKEEAGEYSLDLHFARGFHQLQLGQLKEACETYKIVAEGDPANETAWNNLGDIQIKMGNIEAAEPFYLQAIEADISGFQGYNKLHSYWTEYMKEERFEEIGPMLERAVENVDANSALYVKLANWYIEAGEYEKAIDVYRRALELKPDNKAIQDDLEKALELNRVKQSQ